jgi:hypothetical protein
MKHKFVFPLVFALLLALTACGPAATAEPTATTAPTETAVPPTATLLPTDIPPPEPTATNTATPKPTNTPRPTSTPRPPAQELSFDWLLSPEEVAPLAETLDIFNIRINDDAPGQYRVCREFLGDSVSANPNVIFHCIFTSQPGYPLDSIIADMFESGQIFPDEVLVESTLVLEDDFAVYVGTFPNGHVVIDLFLLHDGLFYWSSVTFVHQGGVTPVEVYKENPELFDAFLIGMINLMIAKAEGTAPAETPTPIAGCRIDSVTPVAGAAEPTYTFVASGFAPNEFLVISLTDTATGGGTIAFGSADAQGQIEIAINFAVAAGATAPTSLELKVGTAACSPSQIVTWP